ncbi:MAG TPA: glycosyltransferase, partial [Acidimicrobiales bacterium]|nr:glycosyltransferase [Acidimicrobiales bacterium]
VAGTDEITGRGLVPGGYVLYVSRLEPENNAHIAIEAYASSGITLPLVVVGGAAYGSTYESSLHEAAGDGVVFCGFVFGEGYRQLQSHASVYLQCTEVGGTHPALIEAMAYGNAVVALDTREHREVLGGAGRYYSAVDELAAILRELADDIAGRERWGNLAASRAAEMFSWEAVTDAYEAAFHAAASRE